MPQTIIQEVIFKNTKPETLYDFYMNSKKHALITGAPAKISTKIGGSYSAHGEYIKGKNIHLVKNKLIVQTWRADDWAKSEMDSIFIINLEERGNDVLLHAIHLNIPDKQADDLRKGWNDYYWNPWKKYLALMK